MKTLNSILCAVAISIIAGVEADAQVLTSGSPVDTNGNAKIAIYAGNLGAVAFGFPGSGSGINNYLGSEVALNVQNAPFLYNGSSANWQRDALGASSNGNAGQGVAAVEESGRHYTHISASQSATNIKATTGFLHTVNINTCVSGATVSLYDTATTTTTTPIAIITCPAATNGMATFTYNIAFTNGLALAASGATDVTVSWR